MSAPGKYIVIDGIDGVGKTELFARLREIFPLRNNGGSFEYTREPGGTEEGEVMRKLIVDRPISPKTEFFLLLAQRVELRKSVVAPALSSGISVISDRSDSSTFAYQIRGRNLNYLQDEFWRLRTFLPPLPDHYIFLDLDPLVAEQRRTGRGIEQGDRFDTQAISFFSRVRDGYLEFARQVERCFLVDASLSRDEVFDRVSTYIRAILSS